MDEMEVQVERLDHLGIVAGTIKDLKIIEMINERIGTSKQEIITTGEAVAAMILNGLGFANTPLYLSPQFFENKALSTLFDRDDIKPNNFNATKLSNSLDAVHDYGTERLFMEIAVSACEIENVDTSIKSLDTTSLSLTGEYDHDSDEHAINVTHGFSKDHRPDLKQVVVELLVSQDGGIPLIVKSWDGNASDTKIFKERSQAIIEQLKKTDLVDYLIADSKLYTADNAENLGKINFISRIPNSNKPVILTIQEALSLDQWIQLDEKNKYYVTEIEHLGIAQRWVTVYSSAANSRAKKRVEKKIKAEASSFNAKIKALNKQKFTSKNDLASGILSVIKKMKFHTCDFNIETIEVKKSASEKIIYAAQTTLQLEADKKQEYIEEKSCYVIGSNADKDKLNAEDIITKYKNQNKSIENMGFRFLKDPLFFTSSLFIKLPKRIEALIFIMTLSLLVYSIAQRKLRNILEIQEIAIPDQLNKSTKKPTLRWVFQLFAGINIVYVTIGNVTKRIIEGINTIKSKIIALFGVSIRKIYGFQT